MWENVKLGEIGGNEMKKESNLAKEFEKFFELSMFKKYRTDEEQKLIENFYIKLKRIDKEINNR